MAFSWLINRLAGDLCQIFHIDRLEPVLAVSDLGEKGETPQDPGDVVDQDILFPENQSGTQDAVTQPGIDHGLFVGCLAAEIGQM